jgi:hypothetical protein
MMSRRFFPYSAGQRAVRSALFGMALLSGVAVAAQHPNTRIHYDATRDINVFDMVMSIDWDFDNPPAGRNKVFIEDILKQASQSFYTMTEGRQMLGKVYVYKNSQFMDNTDIQYLQQDGRANAHIAAITTQQSGRNQMFAGTGETPDQHGKTLAHEFGHYVLGLFDEYREEGGTSTEPGSPQDGDTPRNSIMHNHLEFVTLSTPDDYPDVSVQKTAQFRTFGKSAWEALVSDPANDPNGGVGRMWFEPFKNKRTPTAASLTKPTSGWEGAFQVVWMGNSEGGENSVPAGTAKNGPINLIVIDTTLTAEQITAQRNAALQAVDAAGNGARVAVIVHPFSSKPLVPITAVSDEASRSAVKRAINAIVAASVTTDTVAADRLFDWAESLLPELFPGSPASQDVAGYRARLYGSGHALGVKDGQVFYYNGVSIDPLGPVSQWLPQARKDLDSSLHQALRTLGASAQDADTPFITLFTTANQSIDRNLVDLFREKRIAINPVAIVTPASRAGNRLSSRSTGTVSLYDLAQQTYGRYLEGSKAGDLARSAGKAANSAEGDYEELVAEGMSDTALAANAGYSLQARIAAGNVDGETYFTAYWSEDDDGKLDFSLTAPDGKLITPTSLPAGIRYKLDAEDGESAATYTVSTTYAGRAGLWTGTAKARSKMSEEVFLEVATKSLLGIGVDILGGTQDDKTAMRAVVDVSGPIPVKGATVRADIYRADTGDSVKSGLVLKDNGVAPDEKIDDGLYSVSLADLSVGEYEIVVTVSSTDGQSVYTTAGSTKKGSNASEIPVPAFQRIDGDVFNKEI